MSPSAPGQWTLDEFFAWDGHLDGRYEFDGIEPVAMDRGTNGHGLIMANLHQSLNSRLRSRSCLCLGPDAGLAVPGNRVRYPDALVTCSPCKGSALTVSGVVAAFEIVSPESSHNDWVVKKREYAEVGTILVYAILESTMAAVSAYSRNSGDDDWKALWISRDVLNIPSLRISIPVAELYEGIDFSDVPPEPGDR